MLDPRYYRGGIPCRLSQQMERGHLFTHVLIIDKIHLKTWTSSSNSETPSIWLLQWGNWQNQLEPGRGSTIFVSALKNLLNACCEPGTLTLRFYSFPVVHRNQTVALLCLVTPTYTRRQLFQFQGLAFDCFLPSSWKDSWRASRVPLKAQLKCHLLLEALPNLPCQRSLLHSLSSIPSSWYLPPSILHYGFLVHPTPISYCLSEKETVHSLRAGAVSVLLTVMPFKPNIKSDIQWKFPSETNSDQLPIVYRVMYIWQIVVI